LNDCEAATGGCTDAGKPTTTRDAVALDYPANSALGGGGWARREHCAPAALYVGAAVVVTAALGTVAVAVAAVAAVAAAWSLQRGE